MMEGDPGEYEQNNISAFKRMFLGQVEFALREYF